MIITKSPLRITLGGGGTDLASYYSQHEGFLISAAIDKYVYITINDNFVKELCLKYSKIERVKDIELIQHPIFREALKQVEIENPWLDINSIADIPAGTGLGSSGSFTTALLKALHTYKGESIGSRALAEEACKIEIEKLGEHIGKQDQYIASYGGIQCMYIERNGFVDMIPLRLTPEQLYNLEDNLIMFFTGYSHSASEILSTQDNKSKENNEEMINNLHFTKQLAYDTKRALIQGRIEDLAQLMNTHWWNKKQRSNEMSNPVIDEMYDYAMKNGAIGGKLIGAGGGGFLLFVCPDKPRLRKAMNETGLNEVRFKFAMEGTQVIVR